MNIRTLMLALVTAISPAGMSQAGSAPAVNAFNHIVVIYQENHSFDDLYGLWGAVEGHRVNGLSNADPPHTKQVRADGKTPYACLLQNDVNLTSPSPLPATCADSYNGVDFQSAFSNAPFKIEDYIAATDTTCPAPGVRADCGILKGKGLPGGCAGPNSSFI
jgi:phospholipase C